MSTLVDQVRDVVFDFNEMRTAAALDFKSLFDFVWIGSAAIFLFFVLVGYTMMAVGSAQVPNVQHVASSVLVALAGGSLAFWAVGYGFAMGGGVDGGAALFIGTDLFALSGSATAGDYRDFVVHWCYAQLAVVVGVAGLFERGSFLATGTLALVTALLVFPVVAHWLWSTTGWLSPDTAAPAFVVFDYGGSAVAHVVGGTTALVAALVVGQRFEVFQHRRAAAIDPNAPYSGVVKDSDSTLHYLGGLALWFGTFGIGQVRMPTAADNRELAALVAVNIILAGAFAGAAAAIFASYWRPRLKTRYLINGIVAGLVSVAAGAPLMQPYSAMATGVLGGALYCAASAALESSPVDDAMDAIAVHLFPGMLALVASSLFIDYDLVARLYGFNSVAMQQSQGVTFGASLLALLCIVTWTAIIDGIILGLLHLAGWLRVAERDEVRGLDTLVDARAEAVRNAMHLVETVPTNNMVVTQRECARCSMWIAGDCVPCGTSNYHHECFNCAACDVALLHTFVLHKSNAPMCTKCAMLGKRPRKRPPADAVGPADFAERKRGEHASSVAVDDEPENAEYSYDYTYEYEAADEDEETGSGDADEETSGESEEADEDDDGDEKESGDTDDQEESDDDDDDESGDTEDTTGDTEDTTGDTEDTTGDTEDTTGDTEDTTGDADETPTTTTDSAAAATDDDDTTTGVETETTDTKVAEDNVTTSSSSEASDTATEPMADDKATTPREEKEPEKARQAADAEPKADEPKQRKSRKKSKK